MSDGVAGDGGGRGFDAVVAYEDITLQVPATGDDGGHGRDLGGIDGGGRAPGGGGRRGDDGKSGNAGGVENGPPIRTYESAKARKSGGGSGGSGSGGPGSVDVAEADGGHDDGDDDGPQGRGVSAAISGVGSGHMVRTM